MGFAEFTSYVGPDEARGSDVDAAGDQGASAT